MGESRGEEMRLKDRQRLSRLAWLGAFVLTASVSTDGTRAEEKETMTESRKATYLVVYRPGPAFISGKPLAEQPLKEHGRYMLSLYKQGTLKFAGGFSDNAGGAAAFEAASDDEARAIVAADPAVMSQVFLAEFHPWRWVDWERLIKK
jgi:uncharacterized protein YciI